MTAPISDRRYALRGKRILVTRPRAQAADLCNKLSAQGAEPILFPTIEIAPLDDYTALDRAIAALDKYSWIVFTSINGVAAFWNRLDLLGLKDLTGLPCRVAAIGPATAQAVEKRGVRAHFIPDEYVAEAIVDGIGDVRGQWILLPRADIAREALAVELANRGAVVHDIASYRTLPAAADPEGLYELRRGVDAITFASASAVRNFVALTQYPSHPFHSLTKIACIGPITAQTAREVGLPADIVATEYTTDGLIAALAHHFAKIGETR
jgi:uroporphyrinogen III methyltransferase/synthase